MKTKKSFMLAVASLLAVAGAAGLMFASAPAAKAEILGNSGSDLGDLFVLNQLFGGNGNILGTSGTGNMNNLGDLFVLEKLFSGNGGVLSGNGDSNLGDLFILNQLFGQNGMSLNNNNLGNLFLLDELFGGNGGVLNGGDSDLGDLFILNQLFSNQDSQPQGSQPSDPATSSPGIFGTSSVTVQRGDTLSQIALETLGDANRYPELARFNNISNPNLIFPGQVIRIPSGGITSDPTLGNLIILDRLFDDGNLN